MARTAFERRLAQSANLKAEEAAGNVADSMEVRLALIERMNKGELTLAEVQAELKKIKREAKAAGKLTRNQAFLRG